MATDISICNLALANLFSADTVTSINPSDGSTRSNQCQTLYPLARESALAEHDWFFARKTINAALDGDGVYDGIWAYKYGLPTDCLVAREVHPKGYNKANPFDLEATDASNLLLTDVATARLTYTYKCEDETRYPTNFVLAISWLLASFLAGPVIQKNKVIADDALKKYEYFLGKARKQSDDQSKAADTDSYKKYRPEFLPQAS